MAGGTASEDDGPVVRSDELTRYCGVTLSRNHEAGRCAGTKITRRFVTFVMPMGLRAFASSCEGG
jgi:hypothetical protein